MRGKFTWNFVKSRDFSWNLHELSWIFRQFKWNFVNLREVTWFFVKSRDFYVKSRDFSWFYVILREITWFYVKSRDFSWFYMNFCEIVIFREFNVFIFSYSMNSNLPHPWEVELTCPTHHCHILMTISTILPFSILTTGKQIILFLVTLPKVLHKCSISAPKDLYKHKSAP